MVKKIYFLRLILPLSKAITAFIDLAVMLLLILMIIYGISPTSSIFYLPLYLGVAVVAGLASDIWLSDLMIRYRDFIHIVPLALRVGMYATPIAYPALAVPNAVLSQPHGWCCRGRALELTRRKSAAKL